MNMNYIENFLYKCILGDKQNFNRKKNIIKIFSLLVRNIVKRKNGRKKIINKHIFKYILFISKLINNIINNPYKRLIKIVE